MCIRDRLATNSQGPISYEKKYQVALESTGISSISANILTFTKPHTFINGESIRVISQNGHLPDGLDANTVYFAITSGIGTNQVKIAQTLNDAVSAEAITINNKGGILDIVSRVSDKIAGDIGHPIQYDSDETQWYVTVGTAGGADAPNTTSAVEYMIRIKNAGGGHWTYINRPANAYLTIHATEILA